MNMYRRGEGDEADVNLEREYFHDEHHDGSYENEAAVAGKEEEEYGEFNNRSVPQHPVEEKEGIQMQLEHGDGDGGTKQHEQHQCETEQSPSNTRHRRRKKNRKRKSNLSTVQLMMIIFYNVSGGPFGMESSVKSAGFMGAILGYSLFPWVWSIPEAAITAELGTTFSVDDASGGLVWVELAFGPCAGWMTGYLGWIAGATDNAIYPALFLDYALQLSSWSVSEDDEGIHVIEKNRTMNATDHFLFGDDASHNSSSRSSSSGSGSTGDTTKKRILRSVLVIGIASILGFLTWLGLDVVGNISIGIGLVSMSPFLVMIVIGLFQIDPQRFRIHVASNSSESTVMDYDDGNITEATSSSSFFFSVVWLGLRDMWSALFFGSISWRPFLNNLFWNLNSFDSAATYASEAVIVTIDVDENDRDDNYNTNNNDNDINNDDSHHNIDANTFLFPSLSSIETESHACTGEDEIDPATNGTTIATTNITNGNLQRLTTTTVLPQAIGWATVLVAAGYLLPLIVAIGATNSTRDEWEDGYLTTAASDIVGSWLGLWVVIAAGVSNIGLYQAELSQEAYQLMGMSDRGYVPKLFGTRSRFGTPTYSILFGTIVVIVMGSSLHLESLIEMLNFNYAISLLMEYAAFIRLRITHPNVSRPFRIRFGTYGCVLFILPPVLMILVVMALASPMTMLLSIAINSFGIILYACYRQEWSDKRDYLKRRFTSSCRHCFCRYYSRIPNDPNSQSIGEEEEENMVRMNE